jgi:hypothetical protein
MKAYKSPCVAVLASVARATAVEYPDGTSVCCITDRKTRTVGLYVRLPDDTAAVAYMSSLEALDEVVAELLAARADLAKLLGSKAKKGGRQNR